jgi:DNA-binding NarL/FixJ family response regulator
MEDSRLRLWMAAMLLAITGVGIMDMVLDWPHDPGPVHVGIEVVFVVLCLGTAFYLGSGWYRSQQLAREIQKVADSTRAERDTWRERAQELLGGLGEAIDAQFREWTLTAAERETALLLLKGFSHKEVARLCHRGERTVRQHAVSVYRKSGLSGRAELSAFFLEDLLLPVEKSGTQESFEV